MESLATPGPRDFEEYPSLSKVKGRSKGGSEWNLNKIQGLGSSVVERRYSMCDK